MTLPLDTIATDLVFTVTGTPAHRRFWAKVTILGLDDCWEWAKARDKDGYGTFWIDGATRRAPRVCWELTHGQPIPVGQVVRHRCDNPPCVNPRHLELGTQRENDDDRVKRARSAAGDANGARLHPERLKRGADHPRYLPGGCSFGHAPDRWHKLPNGERICKDCQAAKRRRQRAAAKLRPDYDEVRTRLNAAYRRRYAARKGRGA